MPDVVNTWDNVQNTSCWVHDGSPWEPDGVVERSAADIVELASAARGSADSAAASAASAGGYADAASGYADAASGYADSASGYAGSCASSVSAASGYADNASAYADSIISGGYVTSSTVSTVVDAAISSGGYVTSADVSDVVDAAVSSGGFVTSAGASAITSDYVSSGGYVTGAGVAAIISSGGYVTSSYVSGATVSSAGVAGKIGTSTVGSTNKPVYISSGVPVSMSYVASATKATSAGTCTGNAATATSAASAGTAVDASSLGGVAASSYAMDADVVKLSGDQTVGGTKTFSNTILGPGIENPSGNTRLQATYSGAVKFVQVSNSTGTAAVNTDFVPNSNGSYILGRSANRWKEIWCSQNSINTSSDERVKQQVSAVPDEVLDAWEGVGWVQFKFNDAVAEKGADARLHNGLIAQRVGDAFRARGLDASRYGLFLYDAWEAQPAEVDEKGAVIEPAQPAGEAYGLRYTEALCMEAAYQRRRADRAEARITALEQRLGELEAEYREGK